MTEEINKCLEVLKKGQLILYPTETMWAVGCDATNEEAVKKIYDLKEQEPGNGLICLVANDAMLERHIPEVPELAYDLMDVSESPITLVYDNPKGIASNALAKDGSLAVRVVSDKFCRYLINAYRKPIIATSARTSQNPIPKTTEDIERSILKEVDYVVPLPSKISNGSRSSIIKIGNDSSVKIIRN